MRVGMNHPAAPLPLDAEDRSTLEMWARSATAPHRVVSQAKALLMAGDGVANSRIATALGISGPTVLYLNPPDQAVVLCVDEKSQIQALDRTQPGLPMKPGRCGTMTHDYKRHGTTTLFAALNVLTGKVIGQCHGRHRHQEFLKFLRRLDRAFPRDLTLHVILDNYATHKHEAGSPLAGGSPALRTALHADGSLVAQPRRELVQPADATTASPRRLLQRAGTRGFGGFPKKTCPDEPKMWW